MVRVAFYQKDSMWKEHRIATKNAEKLLAEYKKWLEENGVEPLIDLTQYK